MKSTRLIIALIFLKAFLIKAPSQQQPLKRKLTPRGFLKKRQCFASGQVFFPPPTPTRQCFTEALVFFPPPTPTEIRHLKQTVGLRPGSLTALSASSTPDSFSDLSPKQAPIRPVPLQARVAQNKKHRPFRRENINKKVNGKEDTKLHLAARNCNVDQITYLLDSGASSTILNLALNLPLHLALIEAIGRAVDIKYERCPHKKAKLLIEFLKYDKPAVERLIDALPRHMLTATNCWGMDIEGMIEGFNELLEEIKQK